MRNEQQQTICLDHQCEEDQATPFGMVCPECKRRLYTRPPRGNLMSFWESQPVAFTLDREPCFAYSLMWEDYRIRSIHLPELNVAAPDSSEVESHS
ncbi:hypothetical protein [Gimesia sp.]|uniref:hypothetical protein n=1 Tax=Gimesia sp. TaxID=2024833 RepID=UPI000C455CBF|nr:hypothetical protein [Gimesia sp.]MAX39079.1 hypothetical protein [Gimesia sp.]HBL47626.1 hypothetical protein [Planctomycetaceae bacterium]